MLLVTRVKYLRHPPWAERIEELRLGKLAGSDLASAPLVVHISPAGWAAVLAGELAVAADGVEVVAVGAGIGQVLVVLVEARDAKHVAA